ncbi:hypothetical protein ZWY2020_020996 [Hordeum vulgare]|nr:hypothetical protein ZWY2020_020996 [Hordeum vulgare]
MSFRTTALQGQSGAGRGREDAGSSRPRRGKGRTGAGSSCGEARMAWRGGLAGRAWARAGGRALAREARDRREARMPRRGELTTAARRGQPGAQSS